MIGILDYQAGNLTSMQYAVEHLGYRPQLITDPEQMLRCSQLIFPGVGEARAVMETLKARGFDQALKDFIAEEKPLLGVCIGAQVLLSHSEERDIHCLDILPGEVCRFPHGDLKVPQIGWNALLQRKSVPFFEGVEDESPVYYVNSYYMKLQDRIMVAAESEYGIYFDSVVVHKNIVATQFHPEKSGLVGLQLLDNFLKMK